MWNHKHYYLLTLSHVNSCEDPVLVSDYFSFKSLVLLKLTLHIQHVSINVVSSHCIVIALTGRLVGSL